MVTLPDSLYPPGGKYRKGAVLSLAARAMAPAAAESPSKAREVMDAAMTAACEGALAPVQRSAA